MQEMRISEIASHFLEGLDYPVGKEAILKAAREASIDQSVQASLEKLPDREYIDAAELTKALNAS
jgi:Protein of unknown function (DUF2795)